MELSHHLRRFNVLLSYAGHNLERFLVRLVFCLFADDTGIFETRDIFSTLIAQRTNPDGTDTGLWLSQLLFIQRFFAAVALKGLKPSMLVFSTGGLRMNRRHFLLRSATASAVSLHAFPYHLFANGTKKLASDRVKLGPQKVELSRLAQGTGTDGVGGSSNQTRKLGLNGLTDLFHAAYDNGITFWDSADQYGTHPHVKQALRGVPREKVTVMSKTHASTEKEMRADLDRFRRELGTDYIDILLLHCMLDDDWPQRKKGAMAVLSEAREKGIIRTHGTSCHTLGALKAAAASPWVEVDLARINPAQKHMDADPATVISVLKQMKASGKGVIGMKILGAGSLTNRIDECLQFALAQDCVDCFTIGSESRAQMEDLTKRIPAASVRG